MYKKKSVVYPTCPILASTLPSAKSDTEVIHILKIVHIEILVQCEMKGCIF